MTHTNPHAGKHKPENCPPWCIDCPQLTAGEVASGGGDFQHASAERHATATTNGRPVTVYTGTLRRDTIQGPGEPVVKVLYGETGVNGRDYTPDAARLQAVNLWLAADLADGADITQRTEAETAAYLAGVAATTAYFHRQLVLNGIVVDDTILSAATGSGNAR